MKMISPIIALWEKFLFLSFQSIISAMELEFSKFLGMTEVRCIRDSLISALWKYQSSICQASEGGDGH